MRGSVFEVKGSVDQHGARGSVDQHGVRGSVGDHGARESVYGVRGSLFGVNEN